MLSHHEVVIRRAPVSQGSICAQCDNPYPYKCRECMAVIYDPETEQKISIASGEDCYSEYQIN